MWVCIGNALNLMALGCQYYVRHAFHTDKNAWMFGA